MNCSEMERGASSVSFFPFNRINESFTDLFDGRMERKNRPPFRKERKNRPLFRNLTVTHRNVINNKITKETKGKGRILLWGKKK